ncbi:PCI domain-containing protein [Fomes fomentarius]|nr:PCI domain-containing protein [Fomes fomentarius]
MLLCKVMLNLPEDVTSLLSIKLASKYAQLRDVESMRAIARAHQKRNLADFEKALKDYQRELSSDTTILTHLSALYDTLLEQSLLRIVEPYSVVEIEYVAQQVGQDRQAVELKLSQMILDKVFHGVLDQGHGCFLIFEEPEADVRRPYNLTYVYISILTVRVNAASRRYRYSGAGWEYRGLIVRKA